MAHKQVEKTIKTTLEKLPKPSIGSRLIYVSESIYDAWMFINHDKRAKILSKDIMSIKLQRALGEILAMTNELMEKNATIEIKTRRRNIRHKSRKA